MYPCDKELVAMYTSGDLSEAEAAPVEAHLNNCPACRALAHELQADALSFREVVLTMQMPDQSPRTRPSRRWIPAVAAALAGVLILGFTAGPTVATTVRQVFGWMSIQEGTQADLDQWTEKLNAWEQTQPPTSQKKKPLVKTDDPAEMAAAVGFTILTPTYLPAGYESHGMMLWPNERDPEQISPHQYWRNGEKEIAVYQETVDDSYTLLQTEGSYREITIGSSQAVLLYGLMTKSWDDKWVLDTSMRQLIIDRGTMAINIMVSDPDLSEAEIIRIAESIPQ